MTRMIALIFLVVGSLGAQSEQGLDAAETKDQLARVLERYPPSLKGVVSLDPSLLNNPEYLSPYPGLVNFLRKHPEIASNPAYFVGPYEGPRPGGNNEFVKNASILLVFAMAVGMAAWLIKTMTDYKRWNRAAGVQTDVHTKLLDRFTSNEDLLAYMQTPAGSKFLDSSISLDAGQKSMSAPVSRILWSLQAGFVVTAAGAGLLVAAGKLGDGRAFQAMGILGIALGVGFVMSAGASFLISRRLGLFKSEV